MKFSNIIYIKTVNITFLLLMISSNCFAQKSKAKEYYNLALEAFNEGKTTESISYAGKGLEFDEWNTDILYVRASAYELEGKIAEALIDYEKINLADESFLEAYMAKAILYYQKKNYKEAMRNLSAIENYAGTKETKAILFKSETYGQGSGSGISGVTSIEGLKNDISYYRGLIYRDTDKLQKARDTFKQLITCHKKPEYLVALGLVYQKMHKNDSARLSYRTALAIDPESHSAAYQLQLIDPDYRIPATFGEDESFHYALAKKGYDLFRKRKYEDALELYNKAINLAPEESDYYASRALVYEKMGRFDEAIDDYREAVNKDANFIANYYRIGNVFFKQKMYEEAIAQYTIYLSYVPDDANIFYNMGLAYLSTKKNRDACKALNKADELGKAGVGALLNKYCNDN
ncbi:MAG: tetratricopeptide repeat protein [Cyclobacteriaceae bacterium]